MNCPNCGNEAINVNGKYVCLDCGIEISAQGTAATAPVATPQVQVSNHQTAPEPAIAPVPPVTPVVPAPAVPETVVQPTPEAPKESQNFFSPKGETVITPPVSSPTTSIKDAYLAELEKENEPALSGSFDFSQPASSTPVPDFPIGTDTTEVTPVEPVSSTAVESTSVPISTEPIPVPTVVAPEPTLPVVPAAVEEPVMTPESDVTEIPQPVDTQAPESATSNPQVNPFDVDLPTSFPPVEPSPEEVPVSQEPTETPEVQPSSAPVEPEPELPTQPSDLTPAQEEPVVSETTTLEASTNPFEANPPVTPVVEESAKSPITENVVPAPEVPGAEVVPAVEQNQPIIVEPESYFQPASLGIAPTAEVVADASGPVQPTWSADAPSPGLGGEEVAPVATEAPVEAPVEAPQAKGLDIDTLLDKYSAPASSGYQTTNTMGGAVDSVRQSQYSSYDLSKGESLPVEENGIPSVASVFEGEAPVVEAEPVKGKNKKLIFILAGALIFLLLVGGAAAYVALSGRGSQISQTEIEKQIVEGVPAKIDQAQELKVSYNLKLDFSKITPGTSLAAADATELTKLQANGYSNSGNWQTNTNGDIAIDSRIGEEANVVKTYIEEDKATYSFEGGKWNKEEGRKITGVPAFFNPVERGSLFYTDNLASLSHERTDTVGELKMYTLTAKPKPDFIKAILAEASPVLAKANVQTINTDNLKITIKVDENNNLYSVTVGGEVTIASDLYNGTVSFTGNGDYQYGSTTIEKPIVLAELKRKS